MCIGNRKMFHVPQGCNIILAIYYFGAMLDSCLLYNTLKNNSNPNGQDLTSILLLKKKFIGNISKISMFVTIELLRETMRVIVYKLITNLSIVMVLILCATFTVGD